MEIIPNTGYNVSINITQEKLDSRISLNIYDGSNESGNLLLSNPENGTHNLISQTGHIFIYVESSSAMLRYTGSLNNCEYNYQGSGSINYDHEAYSLIDLTGDNASFSFHVDYDE